MNIDHKSFLSLCNLQIRRKDFVTLMLETYDPEVKNFQELTATAEEGDSIDKLESKATKSGSKRKTMTMEVTYTLLYQFSLYF